MSRLVQLALMLTALLWYREEPLLKGAPAPVDQTWAPATTTASNITGTVTLSPRQLKMARKPFPLTFVQQIDRRRLADASKIVGSLSPPASASLFKTLIPKRAALLNGNSICGEKDASWMLAAFTKDSLSLAFFSGNMQPNLDPQVVSTSTDLCGTYGYVLAAAK